MHQLQYSQVIAEVSDVQSRMHPLWGADYSVLGNPANHRIGVLGAPQGDAEGVDGLGPFGGTDTRPGQGRNGVWPGREYGVRRPHPTETALSWGEVMFAVREGIL